MNWRSVVIGVIIAVVLTIILSMIAGSLGGLIGFILAAIYVGSTVGENYRNGAIHGAIVTFLAGIIVGVIIVILSGALKLELKFSIYLSMGLLILIETMVNSIFGAIGGIIGVFIRGTISPKENSKIIISKIIIIFGCIGIVMGLPSFLLYGELSPDIFLILGGIILILMGVYNNKGYFNKNYYMANFSVIALWGLILLYIFLFKTSEYLMDRNMFYIQTGILVVFMIMFTNGYIRRRRDVHRRKELDL
ncbi:DUF5518 domain-containing protein [Methanobacterium congolense]|uniref:Uncharacterized protein n=1 Tax=Methanobacterium congolense TaxID=118062 RepID=A0A1D3L5N0_9EURY|nr:DUF5518 domain-containing protein [Methanobacterium congolense]SCG86856.1 putative protein [Methanobacterium congolense]